MDKLKAWFKGSETIFIARVKMMLGLGFTAVQQSGVNLASIIDNPKLQIALQVFMAYLVLDGTLSEWARRRNATDL